MSIRVTRGAYPGADRRPIENGGRARFNGALARMSDKTAAFVDTHGLGRLDEQLPLRGKLAIAGLGLVKADLCWTPRGIWVVAAQSDSRGDALNLLERPDFRYERRALGDKIHVADTVFGISRARSTRARQLLGVARLRQRFGTTPQRSAGPLRNTPFVEPITELERVWLDYTLAHDEILLAWLHGMSEAFVSSPIETNASSDLRLLVTSRATRLVALTELGDVRAENLSPDTLKFDLEHGRATLRTPNWEFRAKRKNDEPTREVLSVLLEPPERQLFWFAQRCWVSRDSYSGGARAARKLAQLAEAAGNAHAAFARVMMRERTKRTTPFSLERALTQLGLEGAGESALADLVESWQFSPQAAEVLIAELMSYGTSAEPWALALHEYVHRLPLEQSGPPGPRAEAAQRDIRLAEHLLKSGKAAPARRLLEARLRALPSEDIDDLLPPEDADLTQGAGGKALRIRIRELIAESRETTDLDTLAELAQLQPLMQARVTALADAAEGTLRLRAESVAALLKPAGLIGDSAARENVRRDAPLSEHELFHLVSHPLAREESPFTTKLQALLASVPTPDHGVLKDYCAKLEGGYAAAQGALEDAARILGVSSVTAYVSRGNKSIGVRAYEDTSPFVLIGGQHLEDGAYRMTASELRFALGAELAHVRLGHTPVTSSEVWAGALNKTREGVDLAFTFLPILKGYKLAGRMSQALSHVPAPAMRQLLSGVERLRARFVEGRATSRDPTEAALSRINEELITAHRVMQLTADRAGLLVSADLQASIRAMLLLRADHRVLLDRSLREGLISVLSERNSSGEMAHQALAVRIAALFSFYLSSEYARLAVSSSE